MHNNSLANYTNCKLEEPPVCATTFSNRKARITFSSKLKIYYDKIIFSKQRAGGAGCSPKGGEKFANARGRSAISNIQQPRVSAFRLRRLLPEFALEFSKYAQNK